jgi:hypothetical protein
MMKLQKLRYVNITSFSVFQLTYMEKMVIVEVLMTMNNYSHPRISTGALPFVAFSQHQQVMWVYCLE